MSVCKRNGWWWVDFRVEGVRYRKKSPLNTQTGALSYEGRLRGRLAKGEPLIPTKIESSSVTLADFAEEWMTTYVHVNNKPSEQVSKRIVLRAHLLPHFGRMTLDEISAKEIEHYKAQKLSSGLSAKTVNNHLAVLRKCLHTAVDWQQLSAVPKVQLLKTVSQRLDFLNEEECRRLMEATSTGIWESMVVVALHTGMRLGELFAVSWPDVDFAHHVITVRCSMVHGIITSTKTHRIRYIPMNARVEAALRSLQETTGLVFRPRAIASSRRSADRAIQRICKKAGIRAVGWHTLRHTFATQLVARGVHLRVVQLLLGHSSVTMTERYAHLAPSGLREAVVLLEQQQLVHNDGHQMVTAAMPRNIEANFSQNIGSGAGI